MLLIATFLCQYMSEEYSGSVLFKLLGLEAVLALELCGDRHGRLEKGILFYYMRFRSYWEGRDRQLNYYAKCLPNEQWDPGRTDRKL